MVQSARFMLASPPMLPRRLAFFSVLLGAAPAFAQEVPPPSPAEEEEAEEEAEEVVELPPPVVVEPPPVVVVAPPAPAPVVEQVKLVVPVDDTGFAFGSYGRILAGSDLRGHTPKQVAVVAHAPRIVEPSYVESDLYYRWRTPSGAKLSTVTTLAFGDNLFHYTGEFDAQPALRNLYLKSELPSGVTLWGGSRMYRGDDLYLFDWWPLDDLNTLGGGASYRTDELEVAVHAGFNRLLDPFQHQTADTADPDGIGATEIEILDRQRTVASASATYFAHLSNFSQKAKLYGEVQHLPSGERRRADATIEELPTDWGMSLGAQLGIWTPANVAHANLFAKWSKGLTAFDELAAPDGLGRELGAWPGASEFTIGGGGAYNAPWGHILGAAYSRRFVDADQSRMDRDDGWEYAIDVRPEVKLAGDFLAGVDLSYQVRFPRGLSPTTLLAADPAVAQIAPMLIYAPMGDDAFDRPQLRLVWRIARLNDAALDDYALDDPRRAHSTVHFLGVQAEWWFNSSTR